VPTPGDAQHPQPVGERRDRPERAELDRHAHPGRVQRGGAAAQHPLRRHDREGGQHPVRPGPPRPFGEFFGGCEYPALVVVDHQREHVGAAQTRAAVRVDRLGVDPVGVHAHRVESGGGRGRDQLGGSAGPPQVRGQSELHTRILPGEQT